MDGLDALATANAGFERRLRLVRSDDWGRPTPCDEWDVRALVNHVVGASRRYTMLLQGASAMEVHATRSVDHLGDDALASFLANAAEVTAAFREEGALERTVHHDAVGDRTGAELLGMRVLDVAVHSWDLARAIDADDTLDADVVDFVLTLPGFEAGRQQGGFAAPVGEIAADSSAQVRLLYLLGRHPLNGRETR